jgi:hypothetical protein
MVFSNISNLLSTSSNVDNMLVILFFNVGSSVGGVYGARKYTLLICGLFGIGVSF